MFLCLLDHYLMTPSVLWKFCPLTMTSFALEEISNGHILCFVKIPSFDDDIFCFGDSFPDLVGHTVTHSNTVTQ